MSAFKPEDVSGRRRTVRRQGLSPPSCPAVGAGTGRGSVEGTGQVACHRGPGARLAAPQGAPSQGARFRPQQARGCCGQPDGTRFFQLGGTQAKPLAPGRPVLAATSGQLSWGPWLREDGVRDGRYWCVRELSCRRQTGSAGPWAATGSPGDRRETAGEGAALGCPLPGLGPLPPARGPPGHSRGAVSTGVCPHCPARGVPCRRPRTSPGILFP